MQAAVGEYSEAFSRLATRRHSEFVGFRHGGGSGVGIEPVAALQFGPASLATHLIQGCRNALFHFCERIPRESAAKVLDNINLVSAANHGQSDDVVGRVEQVRAMRG